MDAIPCGAITLLKGSARSQFSLSKIHSFDTVIGKICFLSPSSGRNKRIRQLFQAEIISFPYIVSHWNGLYDNIPWKKEWTLSSKYLITNKVKDVSYKLLQLFYPVKLYMKKQCFQILILYAPFVRLKMNLCPIFFGNVHILIYFGRIFVHAFSSQSFFLLYKYVLFGWHNFTKDDKDKYYLINLFIFLAKFFLHKCKFQGAKPYFPVLCKDLKSYLDTLLTSNNSLIVSFS